MSKSSLMSACERVRMFRPPASAARRQWSQLQNTAGQPSAAAVPRYLNFIAFSSFRYVQARRLMRTSAGWI